jgi:hypothetical protein
MEQSSFINGNQQKAGNYSHAVQLSASVMMEEKFHNINMQPPKIGII